MMKYFNYITPIGKLGISEDGGAIVSIVFDSEPTLKDIKYQETDLIKEASKQLSAYFRGQRHGFDLPLTLKGTDFQQKVWQALLQIPYGKTASYGQIAKAIGNDKASRAVGMACNRNPLPILIPCHRVVGANGNLVGYAGGLDIKQYLLSLEQTYQQSPLGGCECFK